MGPSAGRGAALPAAVGAAVRAQAVRAAASARRHKLQAAGACFGLRQAQLDGLCLAHRGELLPARCFGLRPTFCGRLGRRSAAGCGLCFALGCCGGELPSARHCELRPARRGGLEQVGSGRRGTALRQALRACSLGCGEGDGRQEGGLVCIAKSCGNFGDIYELGCLLELCSLFSGSALEDLEISLFFIYLSVSKDTTQESGTARCLP